jgi:hypothetical protein
MEAWTCILTLLIFLVGLLVGAVLGLNGFGQPAAPGAIGQSPRIKNLLWLFSGFLPALLLDFHKLGLPQDYPLYWPVGGYGLGALIGAITAVAWMTRSITRSVRIFNREHSSTIDPGELQREYLTYGKARFEDRWRERQQAALAAEEGSRIALEADKVMARCVHGVLGHLASDENERKRSEGPLIDAIMDAILSVVRVHAAGTLVLRGSYMAYIPSDAADHLRGRALFTRDMPDRYVGYLELRRGGGLAVRNVVLPVAADTNCILPGAPEAVAVMGVAMMNLRQLEFRRGVSKVVEKEGRDYFLAPYFDPIASVTSLVIQDGGAVHGVMNIESSAPDLLGKDREAAQVVIGRLQILIALLSVFR